MTDAPRYLREPPDEHPAVVGYLERPGRLGEEVVQASLLLLVASGALEQRRSIRRVTTIARAHDIVVTELRPVPERWDGLDSLDKELVSFLWDTLGGAGALSLADLQAAVRRRPGRFAAGLQHWQSSVAARAEQLGLAEGDRRTGLGTAARERHHAFRRYLHDFGTLEDEPPVAVELWGPYLAYAVLFGLGDRVARELGLDSPSVAADPNLAVWKTWLGLD
jgi:hypothetical protein